MHLVSLLSAAILASVIESTSPSESRDLAALDGSLDASTEKGTSEAPMDLFLGDTAGMLVTLGRNLYKKSD